MPCRPLQVKVYSGLFQKTPLTRVMTHLSVIGSLCFCQFGNVTCNLFFRIVLGLLKKREDSDTDEYIDNGFFLISEASNPLFLNKIIEE